jgi:hypothetical protein
MSIHLKTLLSLACLSILAGSPINAADLNWEWSFSINGGLEKGQFVTNGGPYSDTIPAGTYTIKDFSVTQSANGLVIGSLVKGDYTILYPNGGFVWDGTQATQFFRLNGVYDNGVAYVQQPSEIGQEFSFYLDGSTMMGQIDNFTTDNVIGSGNLSLTPVNSVPEPSTYALAAIASGVMAALARHRKARQG